MEKYLLHGGEYLEKEFYIVHAGDDEWRGKRRKTYGEGEHIFFL